MISLTDGLCQPTVNVGSEHVGHGTDGGLLEGGNMAEEGLLVKGTQFGPLHSVQRVDQVHEGGEISVCVCVCVCVEEV